MCHYEIIKHEMNGLKSEHTDQSLSGEWRIGRVVLLVKINWVEKVPMVSYFHDVSGWNMGHLIGEASPQGK